jgi:hypothetical protein
VRYHLASTIHRIQGDTVALYATQVSEVEREYRLWQKEQLAVLISRAEHCNDIIFVGPKTDTRKAIVSILQRSSKWDVLIDHFMTSLNVLSTPCLREINLQIHPFLPLYRELPAGSRSYVYLLVSITNPRICYVGETDDLKQCLRRHNTGYGDTRTRPTNLHPWGVYAFVCGFEIPDVGADTERRREFLNSVQHSDLTRGPEFMYGLIRDEVSRWNLLGFKSLVLVKCGEVRS